ncbi:hypothetical protein EYF80_066405 [Liparis tanakae]|uniref:Uncharacterized protein n=1 Tax=Liparis tanakae TaxID=230148 RepID=A0A4Z2E4D4_9TELE|nr:hypothetical protein EYF80_066405 [Liparis tanakae]
MEIEVINGKKKNHFRHVRVSGRRRRRRWE